MSKLKDTAAIARPTQPVKPVKSTRRKKSTSRLLVGRIHSRRRGGLQCSIDGA